MDADFRGGWLQTPVIRFKGNCLHLNIDTGAMGTAFVEIQDQQGHPIPGYTMADCQEVGGNFTDQKVYWSATSDLSPIENQLVRIKFKLTRAKLFAFQFRGD